MDDDGTAYEWDSVQRRFVECGSAAGLPDYGVDDMTFAVEADVIPPIPERPQVRHLHHGARLQALVLPARYRRFRPITPAGVLCRVQESDAEDEEEAAEKEGGAKQRPGADKRKLADAFEREKNKKERAKEIAEKKARRRTPSVRTPVRPAAVQSPAVRPSGDSLLYLSLRQPFHRRGCRQIGST